MTDAFLGAALGGLVATGCSIPAIMFQIFHRDELTSVPVMRIHTLFGYAIKKQEAFWVGLLIHVLVGMLFGGCYGFFADYAWTAFTHRPYSFPSFFAYALVSWVVVNVTVYPLLGMGWFGKKEGHGIWLETFFSHVLLAIIMALLVRWFQPFYF